MGDGEIGVSDTEIFPLNFPHQFLFLLFSSLSFIVKDHSVVVCVVNLSSSLYAYIYIYILYFIRQLVVG